jgi:hypothetical protein
VPLRVRDSVSTTTFLECWSSDARQDLVLLFVACGAAGLTRIVGTERRRSFILTKSTVGKVGRHSRKARERVGRSVVYPRGAVQTSRYDQEYAVSDMCSRRRCSGMERGGQLALGVRRLAALTWNGPLRFAGQCGLARLGRE